MTLGNMADGTGIYNMSDGSLRAPDIVEGPGTAEFNFSGGEIVLDGNRIGFAADNDWFNVTGPNAANYIELLNENDTTSLTFILTIGITRTEGSNLVKEEGSTTDSFDVVLLEQPDDVVTVPVDPNTDGDDYKLGAAEPNIAINLVFGTDNWDTPQTVTITAVDDDEPEATETAKIVVTGDSTDADFNVALQTFLTIQDNDSAAVFITESDSSTDVVEGGATDSYTVVLGFPPNSDVMITIDDSGDPNQATVDGGETTTLTFTPDNWDTPQTVTVEAVNDDVPEADPHNTALTHSVSQPGGDNAYDGLSVTNVTVSVGENDCGPGPFVGSDLNEDCITNLLDFAILAGDYLFCSITVCD